MHSYESYDSIKSKIMKKEYNIMISNKIIYDNLMSFNVKINSK